MGSRYLVENAIDTHKYNLNIAGA